MCFLVGIIYYTNIYSQIHKYCYIHKLTHSLFTNSRLCYKTNTFTQIILKITDIHCYNYTVISTCTHYLHKYIQCCAHTCKTLTQVWVVVWVRCGRKAKIPRSFSIMYVFQVKLWGHSPPYPNRQWPGRAREWQDWETHHEEYSRRPQPLCSG